MAGSIDRVEIKRLILLNTVSATMTVKLMLGNTFPQCTLWEIHCVYIRICDAIERDGDPTRERVGAIYTSLDCHKQRHNAMIKRYDRILYEYKCGNRDSDLQQRKSTAVVELIDAVYLIRCQLARIMVEYVRMHTYNTRLDRNNITKALASMCQRCRNACAMRDLFLQLEN